MGEQIELVKSQTNILDVIGQDMKLEKKGNAWKGLCPFHGEKTPSFTVDVNKQIFHCFGCGKGGDVFKYLGFKGMDFSESLKLLAERAGVDLTNGVKGKNHRLYEMNTAATEFYQDNLKKDEQMLSYLKEQRGLTDESIETFKLGCTNGALLTSVLKRKGFREKEIIEAGLGRENGYRLSDLFYDKRVMFPFIFRGKVTAFGGRVVGDALPKYINSPETAVFKKKDLLYGLKASAIKEAGYVFITEGYIDVIMGHQHGHKNTVAPLGTAFTADQLQLLREYTSCLYPVFDGDKAGKEAAYKAAKMLFREKLTGGIILLPEGEDLDSFLRKGGDLEALRNKAVPFSVHIARKHPRIRRVIHRYLLFRSPLETSEFLSYDSTHEERRMAAEMSARLSLAKLIPKESRIVWRDDVEVRKHEQYLALFSSGGFKLLVEITEDDHKVQATKMLNTYLQMKRRHLGSTKKK